MATIGSDSGGRKRILFVAGDGSRKTVRLGPVSARAAESVRLRIEELASATMNGHPLARDTALWLGGIGDTLHDRLARAGLVQPREAAQAVKLGRFIDG